MERNPKIIVLDASVIVKWFNEEIYTDNAIILKDNYLKKQNIIYEPSLLFYEVSNALRYNSQLGEKDVIQAIQNLIDLQLKIVDMNEWFLKSISLAYKHGITIYDAAYLALGLSLNAPIYTADEKLEKKVQLLDIIHIKQVISM
ncbi:MAG TPA: type II toxin-antitoxin system VapC family toxin [Candidatus Deferrimicrobium sp.]|nr:type II toxin-antitoxin system VapC family toxin [Candidatus Deferrimicrobium sp.]